MFFAVQIDSGASSPPVNFVLSSSVKPDINRSLYELHCLYSSFDTYFHLPWFSLSIEGDKGVVVLNRTEFRVGVVSKPVCEHAVVFPFTASLRRKVLVILGIRVFIKKKKDSGLSLATDRSGTLFLYKNVHFF